jgi:antitoxin YefM
LTRPIGYGKGERALKIASDTDADAESAKICIPWRWAEILTIIYVQHIVHIMNAITYSEARAELASTIKRVCRDRSPVIITRKREDAVVMMSLADYESLTETAYLLRNPRNAKRLLDSIKQLEAGKGKERALLT